MPPVVAWATITSRPAGASVAWAGTVWARSGAAASKATVTTMRSTTLRRQLAGSERPGARSIRGALLRHVFRRNGRRGIAPRRPDVAQYRGQLGVAELLPRRHLPVVGGALHGHRPAQAIEDDPLEADRVTRHEL